MKFAKGTSVPVDRSEIEIKKTLEKYGADDVVSGTSKRKRIAYVQFFYCGMHIKIEIPLPDLNKEKYLWSHNHTRKRTKEQGMKLWKNDCRQIWRIILLLIKAQLEAVELKALKATEVFLPWLILPNGRTIHQHCESDIKKLIDNGDMPKLLGFGGSDA